MWGVRCLSHFCLSQLMPCVRVDECAELLPSPNVFRRNTDWSCEGADALWLPRRDQPKTREDPVVDRVAHASVLAPLPTMLVSAANVAIPIRRRVWAGS